MIHLNASFNGYHDPRKHKGLTAEDFLFRYLKRQSKMAVNGSKLAEERTKIVVYLLANWDKSVIRVLKLFPRTLV